jgi:hypothetical protein
MIDQIRYSQQIGQGLAIQAIGRNQQAATYKGRDPLTGNRIIEGADGGLYVAEYRGITAPDRSPIVIRANAVGIPDYVA